MENMKYLFLDVEWNQMNQEFYLLEDEILEIAGICFTDDFTSSRKFSKIVQPEHMESVKAETLKLLGISVQTLYEAMHLPEVIERFCKTFPKYEVIVVWNKNSYDLFVYQCGCYGIKLPGHRVVIVQELISIITNKKDRHAGIHKVMNECRLKYNSKSLHHAKYNVECLEKLYIVIRRTYQKRCDLAGENYMKADNSYVIHHKKCHHASIIRETGRMNVKGADLFEGYHVCRHCKKHFLKIDLKNCDTKKPVLKDLWDDDYINGLCNHFGLTCQISNGVIFVKTNIATWRIYHNGKKVLEVYHENYRFRKDQFCKKKKCNEGYHKQEINDETLFGVLRYIQSHDKHLYSTKKIRKSKVEQLFEKIENKMSYKEGDLKENVE